MRQFLLSVIGILFLWLTGTSLVLAGQTEMAQEATPENGTAQPSADATPTIDRLAAPPTVYPPTQADDGAQLFWLYCQPCHGDKGQGLTDEWRAEYPEEHQNCWARGCHAKDPYPEGFQLPTSVPAVIGEGSLFRFATMEQVFNYIRAEMPLEYPGSLTDDEYLAITAFLARAHGAGDGTRLTINNVQQVRLRPVVVAETIGEGNLTGVSGEEVLSATPEPAPGDTDTGQISRAGGDPFVWIGIAAVLLLAGGGWIWLRFK